MKRLLFSTLSRKKGIVKWRYLKSRLVFQVSYESLSENNDSEKDSCKSAQNDMSFFREEIGKKGLKKTITPLLNFE